MDLHIINSIDHISRKHPNTGLLVCGDFNTLTDNHLRNSCSLKQITKVPTHATAILDKVYTNMDTFFAGPQVLPPSCGQV